jgi:fused signal recognition particle receptor
LVFEVLRSTIRGLIDRVRYRTLSREELDRILSDTLLELVAADVAYEVAESIVESVRRSLVSVRVERGSDVGQLVVNTLRSRLLELVDRGSIDIVGAVRAKCSRGEPYVIVFFGVNGVGKTTTIAKVAYMLKVNGVTPVLAAADTFRAGAQEQLEVHASKLGVPIIKGRYGSDPASVAHDAIEYARARRLCAVLVDTAGRMHVDYDLMGEMRKIVRVSKPDLRVLVVDALTGGDAVEQARRFNEEVGVDAVIVAKVDADVKGGSIISVTSVTGKPVIYLGVGQGYEDLKPFNPVEYVDTILGLKH